MRPVTSFQKHFLTSIVVFRESLVTGVRKGEDTKGSLLSWLRNISFGVMSASIELVLPPPQFFQTVRAKKYVINSHWVLPQSVDCSQWILPNSHWNFPNSH